MCIRDSPYKKDDNAHIEQKNWTHVRKLVGYLRYDTPAAVAALNDLYRHELRLLQNLFLPSVKLRRKVRVGARLRRRYDPPQTPLDRLRAWPDADRKTVAALVMLRERLDPFVLSQTIDRKLERLFALGSPGQPQTAAPLAPLATPPTAPPPRLRRPRRGGFPPLPFGHAARRRTRHHAAGLPPRVTSQMARRSPTRLHSQMA